MPDVITPDLLTPTTSDWTATGQPLADVLTDADPQGLVLALPVGEGGLAIEGPVAEAIALLGLDAASVGAAHEPSSEPGKVTAVPLVPAEHGARSLQLVGVGDGKPEDLRQAGAALGRAVRGRQHLVTTITAGASADAVAALVEGCALGGYTPPRWSAKASEPGSAPVGLVTLVGVEDAASMRHAATRSRAVMLARNLSVTPSNLKNPAWMAEQASALGRAAGLRVRVWTDAELRTEGFGGLLAVGGASATPPRLVQVDYEPPKANRKTPRVVLVGKGITFDTGGLDIKPAEGMLAMKTDMSGSAIVLAVLAACRDLEVPVRVTGLLALAENAVGQPPTAPATSSRSTAGAPSRSATPTPRAAWSSPTPSPTPTAPRPRHPARHRHPHRGRAGRLRAQPGPGVRHRRRSARGARRRWREDGERLWPLPLVADYRALLDSEVADINHIAGPGGGAGSITAALFLREFAGDRRWAHLDIAGTGRSDVDRGLLSKGATGFGARLLLTWLEDMR